MKEFVFKKFGGVIIPDVGKYISDYLKKQPFTKIYIGTDSHQSGKTTNYATAIVLYDLDENGIGHGAHVIYARNKENKTHDIFTRIWTEITYSVEVAEIVCETVKIQREEIVIDIDVNPNEHEGSNVVFNASVGYIKGIGFGVRAKPDSWAASCSADLLCKF